MGYLDTIGSCNCHHRQDADITRGYLGWYENLNEVLKRYPTPRIGWSFNNVETRSVWIYDGRRWCNTTQGNPFTMITDVNNAGSVRKSYAQTFYYIPTKADVNGGTITFRFDIEGKELFCDVDVWSISDIVFLEWTGSTINTSVHQLDDSVVKHVEQTLNKAQKLQARENIGAIGSEQVTDKTTGLQYDILQKGRGNIYPLTTSYNVRHNNTTVYAAIEKLKEKDTNLDKTVVKHIAQSLTEAQKLQAQINIGAVSKAEEEDHMLWQGRIYYPETTTEYVRVPGENKNLATLLTELSSILNSVVKDVETFLSDADVSESAKDTLRELQEYINQDVAAAAEMLASINKLKTEKVDVAGGNVTNTVVELGGDLTPLGAALENVSVFFNEIAIAQGESAARIEHLEKEDVKNKENIRTLDEQKANKEGTYPNLTSGFANNLVGRGEATPEVFTFRQSGGSNTSIDDGTARLKSIKGNSVVFNQLFLRGANSNYYQWEDSKVTINGTITSDYETYDTEFAGAIFSLANDHILFVNIRQLSGKVTTGEVQIRTSSFVAQKIITITPESSNAELSFIGQYLSSGNYYTRTKILANTTVDNLVLQYQIFDLTTMFGAGKEPQTVEGFRALYPNDYYEYNTGEIINSNYTAIESVGFNTFDGELEVGAYSNITGLPLENDTYSRSKNYIEILSGAKYYFSAKTGISYIRVRCYDSNYNFISYIGAPYSPNSNDSPSYNNPITIPNGASYITFDTNKTLDIAQNLDICINLVHTGYRNGQYEPYHKDIINLPNIELKKAGNVYDEVRYNPNSEKWEYVQRVGSVDLGELNWMYYTNQDTTAYPYGYLAALVAGRQKGVYNILCSRYTYSGGFTINNNIFGNSASEVVYIIDSNYTNGLVFKEAMKGQILHYELAEPIITELDGDYSTDYIVSDFGTEKAVTDKLCAPFSADIIYQFNAVDRIRENSAKIAQLEALIIELNNKLLAQEAESINNINLEEE